MNIGINLSITGTIVLNPPVSEPAEELGPELVTNGEGGTYIGDFSAGDAGFTITGGAFTIASGVAVAEFAPGFMTVTTPNEAPVVGNTYRFVYTISGGGSPSIAPWCGDTSGTGRTADGTYTEDLVYSGSSGLRLRNTESVDAQVDDWSVREVL